MNILIGLGIVLFIFFQAFVVCRYIYLRVFKPNSTARFPVLSLLIFIACCLFYSAAFVWDYFQ